MSKDIKTNRVENNINTKKGLKIFLYCFITICVLVVLIWGIVRFIINKKDISKFNQR